MISLLLYNLQNIFKKICNFLKQVKIVIGRTEYELKLDSRSSFFNLKFEVLQFSRSFRYKKVTNQVK